MRHKTKHPPRLTSYPPLSFPQASDWTHNVLRSPTCDSLAWASPAPPYLRKELQNRGWLHHHGERSPHLGSPAACGTPGSEPPPHCPGGHASHPRFRQALSRQRRWEQQGGEEATCWKQGPPLSDGAPLHSQHVHFHDHSPDWSDISIPLRRVWGTGHPRALCGCPTLFLPLFRSSCSLPASPRGLWTQHGSVARYP